MVNLFTRIPLLRFLLPTMIGIILSCSQLHHFVAVGFLVLGILCYLHTTHNKEPYIQYKINYRYYTSLFCIIIAFSWINSLLLMPNEIDVKTINKSSAIAIINEINDKDNSMSIVANVVNHIDSCGKLINNNPFNVKINIEGVNYKLKVGDIINYNASYARIENMNNPDEFDYATFMARKGILYSQHIKNEEYDVVGRHTSIFTIANDSRNYLTNRILTSDLHPTTQEFLITIILGDRKMIDNEIRNEFSNAGIAHILALSGLHVAIIVFLLSIILYPLDLFRLRSARLLITLLIIIIYAFITGLTPSVVRATIMTAFFIMSFIIYRKNSSLNALCGAALFILIISPMEIFSVGFQLSFIAVASILIFTDSTKKIMPQNKIGYYLTSLIIVSLSSMIGTGIVSAYYFNTIPILFLIGNILIIPSLPLILGLATIYIIYPSSWLGVLVDFSYTLLLKIVSLINSIPFATIENINVTYYDIIYFYILVALILAYHYSRNSKVFLGVLSVAIIWIITSMILPRTKYENGIVVFNDYRNTPILYYENSKGYLLFDNENKDLMQFKSYHLKFLLNRGIEEIHFVNDSINLGKDIFINNPHICVNSTRFVVISKKTPLSNSKIDIDYLIVTKGYYGKIEKLLKIYNPKLIVLSGNIYDKREAMLKEECNKLGVACKSIQDEGALYLPF